MEVERDILGARMETRDRLVLETMRNVYQELERRPHWWPGAGIPQIKGYRERLLGDWKLLVDSVREEVESATVFNVEIERSDWPDIPTCLVLGLQAFLEGKAPKEAPPFPVVETWKLVCSFLTLDLVEQRQHMMSGYLEDFITRHKAENRIGPAFHPGKIVPPEGA